MPWLGRCWVTLVPIIRWVVVALGCVGAMAMGGCIMIGGVIILGVRAGMVIM